MKSNTEGLLLALLHFVLGPFLLTFASLPLLAFAFPAAAAFLEGVFEFPELLREFAKVSLHFASAIVELVAFCLGLFTVALDLLGCDRQFLEVLDRLAALGLQLLEMRPQFSLGMLPLAETLTAAAFLLFQVCADFIGLAFQLIGAVVLAGTAQFLNLPLEMVQALPEALSGVLLLPFLAAVPLLAVLAGMMGQLCGHMVEFLPRLTAQLF